MANQFVAQVLVYTAVIFGVMYWSGTQTTKTVYDTYPTELDGSLVSVSDAARSAEFYRRVLELEPVAPQKTGKGIIGIRLPDGRRLYLRPGSAAPLSPVAILRVRGGLKKLHSRVVRNLGQAPTAIADDSPLSAPLPPGSVSRLLAFENKREFHVTDPDGNRIIFYEPRRRSFRFAD